MPNYNDKITWDDFVNVCKQSYDAWSESLKHQDDIIGSQSNYDEWVREGLLLKKDDGEGMSHYELAPNVISFAHRPVPVSVVKEILKDSDMI